MEKVICKQCSKELQIPNWRVKNFVYCSWKCKSKSMEGTIPWNKGLTKEDDKILMSISKKTSKQLKREYSNGTRDRFKIVEKAQKVAHKKQKEFNWLNTKESRDKLRKIMQTEEYSIKISESHKGEKNGMFGKRPPNYIHGKGKGYSRGPRWRKIAKLCKIRDNFKCQSCGITEQQHLEKIGQFLQVHHLIPFNECKEHKLDNLITLCAKHHGLCQNYDFNSEMKQKARIGFALTEE